MVEHAFCESIPKLLCTYRFKVSQDVTCRHAREFAQILRSDAISKTKKTWEAPIEGGYF